MPPRKSLHYRERRVIWTRAHDSTERPRTGRPLRPSSLSGDLALLLWLARIGSRFGSGGGGWRRLCATAVTAVFVGRVELLRRLDEGFRVLHQALANIGILIEVVLQLRMALHVLLVLYQAGILGELLVDAGMAAEEFSEVTVRFVARAATRPIFVLIVTGFLLHERIRILLYCGAYARVLLQVGLQRGMVFQELIVVYE